jgi:hypothetical protein
VLKKAAEKSPFPISHETQNRLFTAQAVFSVTKPPWFLAQRLLGNRNPGGLIELPEDKKTGATHPWSFLG